MHDEKDFPLSIKSYMTNSRNKRNSSFARLGFCFRLYLPDGNHEYLASCILDGLTDDDENICHKINFDNKTAVNVCFLDKKLIFLNNPFESTTYNHSECIYLNDVGFYICVPIIEKTNALGVLELSAERPWQNWSNYIDKSIESEIKKFVYTIVRTEVLKDAKKVNSDDRIDLRKILE